MVHFHNDLHQKMLKSNRHFEPARLFNYVNWAMGQAAYPREAKETVALPIICLCYKSFWLCYNDSILCETYFKNWPFSNIRIFLWVRS